MKIDVAVVILAVLCSGAYGLECYNCINTEEPECLNNVTALDVVPCTEETTTFCLIRRLENKSNSSDVQLTRACAEGENSVNEFNGYSGRLESTTHILDLTFCTVDGGCNNGTGVQAQEPVTDDNNGCSATESSFVTMCLSVVGAVYYMVVPKV